MKQSDLDACEKMTRRVVDLTHRLAGFVKRTEQYRKAGFPSSSVPEAISGSSDPVLPGFDKVDAALTRDQRAIVAFYDGLKGEVDRLERIVNGWLIVAPRMPDERVVCDNTACANLLNEGRKGGICQRCIDWRRDNQGMDYPKKPLFDEQEWQARKRTG